MLDHIILTVSGVERSLAFYEAALKPLNIKFFMPFKGEDGHPDLWGFGDGKKAFFWIKQGKPDPAAIHWGFMAEDDDKVDEFYRAAMSAGARDNISPRARLEYFRATTPPMYSTLTGIRSRSSIKANHGTAHHHGERSMGRNRRQGLRSWPVGGAGEPPAAHESHSQFLC
jgi:catechol 2,3-dioxygenase-like lactoylglutathione lyase family enzyme